MTDPLWGGRFRREPDADMLRLTRSIEVDIRLLPQDARATKAHARALVAAGLLDPAALAEVDRACDELVDEWQEGNLVPGPLDEDVHSLVERELTERLGEIGARMHAGRSRNDLVAQDLKLWCADAATALEATTAALVETLLDRAAEHVDDVMPGYTHLQRAQPVSVSFYLCAHASALVRDVARFQSARRSAGVSALGAGALAGTTLALDPRVVAGELALDDIFVNAMDAVSERDFVCDLLYACAVAGMHLSRLAEEIVVFSTTEFGFVRLPDEWSTGSSMMPQKRNPDMAELVRARAAGGIADLGALLTMLKGLPLAYDRDLQEDKAIVFASVDRTAGCLEAMTKLMARLTFEIETMAAAASGGATWATDAAEALVAEGVPFREAHARAGKLVAEIESGAADVSTEPAAVAGPVAGMRARRSHGGTAPERVAEQIAHLRSFLTSPESADSGDVRKERG